jgi:hypothetical protein
MICAPVLIAMLTPNDSPQRREGRQEKIIYNLCVLYVFAV